MTIGEIEAQTGLSRATVRYYESEGFIHPERRENDYREYSQDDLETLLRIKLLRALSVSLPDIRAVQEGSESLESLMARQALRLRQEQEALSAAEEVCRQIRETQTDYRQLDARPYLTGLEQGTHRPVTVPKADTERKPEIVHSPWRRYFARSFDHSLASLAAGLPFIANRWITVWPKSYSMLLIPLLTIVVILIAEPVLLATWGTTPGKWIFGLYVREPDDEPKLGWIDAFSRTFSVLWYGYGMFLPVVSLVRIIKCYNKAVKGETLPWEEDTDLRGTGRRMLPAAFLYVGASALVIGLHLLSWALFALPKNRAPLTAAGFAENYNFFSYYYGYSVFNNKELQADGSFQRPQNDTVIISYPSTDQGWQTLSVNGTVTREYLAPQYPVCTLEETDGVLTAVRLTMDWEGEAGYYASAPNYQACIINCLRAYVKAQPGYGLWSKEFNDRLKEISADPWGDLSFRVEGLEVRCEYRFAHFFAETMPADYKPRNTSSVFGPSDGQAPEYHFFFEIRPAG